MEYGNDLERRRRSRQRRNSDRYQQQGCENTSRGKLSLIYQRPKEEKELTVMGFVGQRAENSYDWEYEES